MARLLACAFVLTLTGGLSACTLITDVDRSTIPSGAPPVSGDSDAGGSDGDASPNAPSTDAGDKKPSGPDAGEQVQDAGDGQRDAGPDGGSHAPDAGDAG